MIPDPPHLEATSTPNPSPPNSSPIVAGNSSVDLPIRARAYAVALPLLVATCFLSVYADMVSKVVQFGVLQIAPPALVVLLFIALCNLGLRKWLRREFFNRAEMLVIYAMQLVAVMLSTRGLVEKLVPPLAWLPYFATRENKLAESVTQHIPPWAVPFVPSAQSGVASPAMRDYWQGNGGQVPWSAWIGPLCAWAVLVGCVFGVFFCLAALLRRQWMDNEQLRFPLTALPLALISGQTQDNQPFFQNRVMWMGVAVSTLIFAINGWSANTPDVPAFVTSFQLSPYLSERPWNAVDSQALYFSPAAFGFAFFLPLDLLFSFWFFHWFTRLQDVAALSLGGNLEGIGSHNARVFSGFQSAGAYLILVISYVRIGWPYFKAAFQTAFSKHKPLDDSGELMSYRAAFTGLLIGVGGIVLWLSLAGMNPFLAFAQMAIYLFFVAVILSRAVSEGGILMTETSFLPAHLINLGAPLAHFDAPSLTMMGLTNSVFVRDPRGLVLTALLDAQKIAKEVGLRPRKLLFPLALAVALSSVVATAFFLFLNYRDGGLGLYDYPKNNARNLFVSTAGLMNGQPLPHDSTAWGGLALGAVLTAGMVWARTQFAWFPFHPLGYAMAPTWAMIVFWFPFFVAWIVKSAVMRFGGIDTYRKVSPFMLGLILGEFSSSVFWSLANMTRGWNVPEFPWP